MINDSWHVSTLLMVRVSPRNHLSKMHEQDYLQKKGFRHGFWGMNLDFITTMEQQQDFGKLQATLNTCDVSHLASLLHFHFQIFSVSFAKVFQVFGSKWGSWIFDGKFVVSLRLKYSFTNFDYISENISTATKMCKLSFLTLAEDNSAAATQIGIFDQNKMWSYSHSAVWQLSFAKLFSAMLGIINLNICLSSLDQSH